MKKYRILPWMAEAFTNNAQRNREILNSHGWNRIADDVFVSYRGFYILIPTNQSAESLYYWKVSNIQQLSPDAIEDNMIVRNKLCPPSGTIPIVPETLVVASTTPVIKVKTPKVEEKKILETIDLSAVNAATRPVKRNKENMRPSKGGENRGITETAKAPNISMDNIRDVWQRFVDIQEQLIRQRCSPICIDVNSIEIKNDKLFVTIDEHQKEQQLDEVFKDLLGAEKYDLADNTILVDEAKWASLTEADLANARKILAENYVELDTTPSINASVNYGQEWGRTVQLSLAELQKLDTVINHGELIEGEIDSTIAFISKVSVQKEEMLKHFFGDHYVVYEQKKHGRETRLVDAFEYHNSYIPWDTFQQYQDIGLTCKGYTLIFKINNAAAQEELKDSFDCWFPNTQTFEFKRSFTKKSPFHKDFLVEANDNIRCFMDEATLYCSQNDIEIEVVFVYGISWYSMRMKKFNEISSWLASKNGYSFNTENGAIGIDFDWRNDDVEVIIKSIEDEISFIKINVHEEHRFKCNVSTKLKGYDVIKKSLEEKYNDISVVNDSVNHTIRINLPYLDVDCYSQLESHLKQDLQQLVASGFSVHFEPRVEGKVRLKISYNSESRLEDLAESIAAMKKADFGFMLEDKEIPFGKLLRADYPNLIFDIDVDESEKGQIIEAFESKAIDTIIPILTGDLEKISRLKNTFTKATTGTELLNERLQRFIFDSSCAIRTDSIEQILRPDGSVYKEMCEHLLNPRINKFQKYAILKAIFAEDLAVIQGPPGTGKSTAIAELIWQLIRNGFKQGNKRERILLTSETNLAVDNAISRIVNKTTNLVKPVRFGDEEKLESEGLQFSLELMKRWVDEGDSCLVTNEKDEDTGNVVKTDLILKNWISNISSRSFGAIDDDSNEIINRWHAFLKSPNKNFREIVYNRYVENANVIGATCSSIGDRRAGNGEFNGFTPFFKNYCDVFKQKRGKAKIEFTTVIQDESSKATPAELVLPFVYGHKAIVIGDHRQLPPMLDKEEFEETLEYALKSTNNAEDISRINGLKDFVSNNFKEMEISHFQRLYENIDDSLKGTFNLQYRMHPDINEVVEQFYREDGGLKCGLVTPRDLGIDDHDVNNPASRYHGIDIKGLITHNTHVLFIDSKSPEMMDGTSRVNYGEVETIDRLLQRFEDSKTFRRYLDRFDKDEDRQIGIISFYGKQIKQLRAVATKHASLPIRVSTVDRFQGMERNIVIVSMVRSNLIQSSAHQEPDWKRYPSTGYPVQQSLGFAQSPNRLNVALSRAKRLLVIVGNKELFSKLDIYQRLFSTIEANKNNIIVSQEEV